ncbi:hydroxyisourate hydrolase [Chryseobacterium shandongense]|uniref:5-hydroxyisourate hydrolase n=1 Tax=Chryseobacterium shandongense TaxID=1493872 RepID=A0A3G6Q3H7_9FLAO|nr:hydroxyisourate hydrolase [Chryseobacterium shandongense]AZA57261.1 hydroxyisourate hydrolase [Chryseobacterium shandongense]AZA85508.1 hydroxyisourate hydrolase [Chryseobacterium shandongense]AZA97680.1 hydroxyisourate hydrolase [Chryseobacterium shandongense]
MKSFIMTILCILMSIGTSAQKNNFQLSTHILDVSKGVPAPGVKIKLEKYNQQSETWTFVDEKKTDTNGRISDFLPSENGNSGIFKLIYYTKDYFNKNNTETFYPFIEVVFEIRDKNHYHVPITLSPYGYSTYRGS